MNGQDVSIRVRREGKKGAESGIARQDKRQSECGRSERRVGGERERKEARSGDRAERGRNVSVAG